MYEYRAQVIRVIDADTLHIEVQISPGLDLNMNINLTIRLYGLNAPEMNTPEGKPAKAWTQQWVDTNAPDGIIMLRTIKDKREKYGRYLGEIYSQAGWPNESLNQDMIKAGHAIPYMVK